MENRDERYKEAEKIAQLGHWDLDIVNNKLFWSDQIYRIFELEPQQFGASYDAFLENIHPDDRDRVNEAYTNSLKNKTPYEIEHRILLNSGKLKYVIEKCRTEYDNSGNPVRSIGMVMDITDRKKVEQALKESEEKFKAISEQASEGITLANMSGDYVFANPAFCNMTGYSLEELLKLKVFDMLDKAEGVIIDENLFGIHQEYILKRKNNLIFPIEIVVNPVIVGNETLLLGMVTNITDRKKVELALKESEKQLMLSNKNLLDERNIFIKGNVVVFKWQNKAGWPVEYVSQNVVNVFGYTHDDFIKGKVKYSDLIHDEDIERVAEEVKRAGGNNLDSFDHREYRIINKSGDLVWLYDFTTVLRNEKNEITHFYGYVKNVTDRKKAEEALKESEINLRESNETKDKFFSVIGHDLRSPFNTMLGFSSLLVDNFDKYDVQKQKKFLGILNKDIQNTYKLLENLLLWSRSEQGIIDYNPEKENLYLLTVETLNLLNRSAVDKSIKLINHVAEDVSVEADKDMLLTVLRNLISNAIKFTSKYGTVEIGCRPLETYGRTSLQKNRFLEITVKDSGVGIAKGKIAKLFKISEDVLTKGTEDETGTGLGLILCKQFVEKHGGKIRVLSEVGSGSEFIFTIKSV